MRQLSRIEYIVLNLLRSGTRMYGLEMVHSDPNLKRGTVYVTLDRMTDKGLVSSEQEKNSTQPGLPRRIYQITGQGSRILRAQDAFDLEMSGVLYD